MVLADGTFDPVHWGHIRYLTTASAFGELSVRVAGDDAILKKGRLVYQSRDERIKTIAALRCVTSVIESELSLADTILALEPEYLVKGIDWVDRLPPEVIAACRATRTQMLFVDTQERTSTERLRA